MDAHASVGIFWDFENCRPQNISSGYTIANNIRQIAHEYGTVKLLKAYVEADSALKPQLRSELQLAGVSLTDCPHNGKKEVADKMIIVDAILWALDNPPSSTVMIISNDRDFGYAISMLRLRRYNVVVISQTYSTPHACLTTQASSFHSWEKEILQTTPSHTRAYSMSAETTTSFRAADPKPAASWRDRSSSFSTASSYVTTSSTLSDASVMPDPDTGRSKLGSTPSTLQVEDSPTLGEQNTPLPFEPIPSWKPEAGIRHTLSNPDMSSENRRMNPFVIQPTDCSKALEEAKARHLLRFSNSLSQLTPQKPPSFPNLSDVEEIPQTNIPTNMHKLPNSDWNSSSEETFHANTDKLSNKLATSADGWTPVVKPSPDSEIDKTTEQPSTAAPVNPDNSAVDETGHTPKVLQVTASPFVPLHFRDLVSLLRTHHAKGTETPSMSKIASSLSNRAALIEAAGASRFGQYCTLASDAGIVDIGTDGLPGTEWLHLRWQYMHDHEAALVYARANHPRFEMLVRTLSHFHIQGTKDVLQTTVAQRLVGRQLDLQQLGAPTFSSYAAEAQVLGIVRLEIVGGKHCISLDPAYGIAV